MKHYAVLIGVNYVDITHYNKTYNLSCAAINVQKMEQMLNNSKSINHLHVEKFTEDRANWINIKNYFKKLKDITYEKNALITIYVSCHGYLLPDHLETHLGQSTQYMYFYDEMVLDLKFQEALLGFTQDVKIHWIIDSCYSGNIPDYSFTPHEGRIKYRTFEVVEKSAGDRLAIKKKYVDERKDYLNKYGNEPMNFTNEVLTFTAANSENVAYEKGEKKPSFFTEELIRLSNNISCDGNYYFFFDTLKSQFSLSATPGIHPKNYLDLKYFKNNSPFKLKFSVNLENPQCKMGLKTIENYDQPTPLNRVTGYVEFTGNEINYNATFVYPNPLSSSDTPNQTITDYLDDKYGNGGSHPFSFIMVVRLESGNNKVVEFTHDKSLLRYTSTSGSNGVVVVVNNGMSVVYGSQPTKGTVTNQLGGS